MKKWISLIGILLFLILSITGSSYERILNYDSYIIINLDGSMEVTENIRVQAEGNQIKRGIYREIPTQYRTLNRNKFNVHFELTGIKKDGEPEPYHIKHLDNGIAIYIGQENVFLKPGEYTYTIQYKTNRQLGFYKDHDELYWNATGNGWGFMIEQASATVLLPPSISTSQIQLEAYTGPEGSRDKNYISYINEDGNVFFQTTQPLLANQGLTIVVGWPKGFILEPSFEAKAEYFLRDNWVIFLAIAGFILLLVYYLVVWILVGIDPRKGLIIPQYKPPDGYSPAAIRYITQMGYDNKTFAVAVTNMAVKGYLRIEEKDDEYTLIKRRNDFDSLTKGEQMIMKNLMESNEKIILKNSNHSKIKKAIQEFTNYLKLNFEKNYFMRNLKYFFPGLVFSIMLVILTILFTARGEDLAILGFMSIWLTIWTIGTSALVYAVYSAWREVIKGNKSKTVKGGGALFLTLFSIPFVGGEIFGIFMVWRSIAGWVALFILTIGFINYLFYHLLKAPTMMGRKLLDHIDGFKMYLTVAEKDRLNMINPVTKTPDLFEKYLPYAMALDVEEQWANQFADIFSKSSTGESTEYTPSWYHGTRFHTAGMAAFTGSFANTLSSQISSSSTAPGSSSGFSSGGGGFSGGGGSSGGGGGGGGGGGW